MPVPANLAAIVRSAALASTPTGRPAATPAPLVVIDTNVVLDLIHWHDPTAEKLAAAVAQGRCRPAASEAPAPELAEVLSRPQSGHAGAELEALLADWLAAAVWVDEAAILEARAQAEKAGLRCLDPLDQKFFELALAAEAAALVSKDKLVIKAGKKMRRRFGIPALRPAEFSL